MSGLIARHAALLLLVAFPFGCTRADRATSDAGMAELEAIQHADPAKAVGAALERHDRRFLAIIGFSLDVPGIDFEGDPDREMLDRYGTRIIVGTTDTPRDERHADLINDARLYAAAYNRLLLWKLSRRSKDRPTTQGAGAR